MTSFADLGLPRPLVTVLAKSGLTEPFPIQTATIPDALAGRDVLGKAKTGSGKTLAFGEQTFRPLSRVGTLAGHSSSSPRLRRGTEVRPTSVLNRRKRVTTQ